MTPSEVDDSDKDKDHIPDDSSIEIPIQSKIKYTDRDSFAHLSCESSNSSDVDVIMLGKECKQTPPDCKKKIAGTK